MHWEKLVKAAGWIVCLWCELITYTCVSTPFCSCAFSKKENQWNLVFVITIHFLLFFWVPFLMWRLPFRNVCRRPFSLHYHLSCLTLELKSWQIHDFGFCCADMVLDRWLGLRQQNSLKLCPSALTKTENDWDLWNCVKFFFKTFCFHCSWQPGSFSVLANTDFPLFQQSFCALNMMSIDN